ncbi:MAG: hypothetical protein HKN10_09180 [Myxococcales bacterium]|nr:hypothetical protein [Myxococcales bacterium]
MASWKNNILIHAPADKVFAYVDDPVNLPDWIPGMTEIRNVIGTGAGQQYEWSYKMAGILLPGQATVVEHVPNECTVHQNIGAIDSIWKLTVEPDEEGTRLEIHLEYHIPIPVIGKLAERILLRRNVREFDMSLVNIKDVMEA